MAQGKRGAGCLVAVLLIFATAAAGIYYKFYRKPESPLPKPSGGELTIRVLDVGQGDSILISTPSGKQILVDAGSPGTGKTILAALKKYNIANIDLFVATHAHPDHIGAGDEVMKAVAVKQVLMTDAPVNFPPKTNAAKNYQEFLAAVDNLPKQSGDEPVNARRLIAAPNMRFVFDDVVLTVLAPTQPLFEARDMRGAGGNVLNANSIVMRLDYGKFSMLLAGDMEAQTEDRLIQIGANLNAQILKVAHHGSRYATSQQLLERVPFRDAIISCGYNNLYGHPHQQTIDRLRAAKTRIYRTDLQGEVTVVSNGKDDYKITASLPVTEDLFTGREAKKPDTESSGFIQYGDFGNTRRPSPINANTNKNANSKNSTNQNLNNQNAFNSSVPRATNANR